jgi:hypothetical protein
MSNKTFIRRTYRYVEGDEEMVRARHVGGDSPVSDAILEPRSAHGDIDDGLAVHPVKGIMIANVIYNEVILKD